MDVTERAKGALVGLAAGDAVGTTLEFKPPGTFQPISDLVGGGPFSLEPGQWTDDTSMALCLGASLLECRGFDARDQMARYCRWRDHGYMSSNGLCFDIGLTVSSALDRFEASGEPLAGSRDPETAGNGSIMRLAPVVLYFFPDKAEVQRYARQSSLPTHAAAECLDCCYLLAEVTRRCLAGLPKSEVLAAVPLESESDGVRALADGRWKTKSIKAIRGTGYVVESLEAALWCFHQADSFREAILLAANLGDDADTTAAITGQVAGAFFGLQGVPEEWRSKLVRADEIEQMAVDLIAR